MSRAAVSKSRAEKTKGGQPPTPAIAHEIVPGKYNDHDWNFMLDRDDGDDFIGEIVEEVCDSALKIIHDKYIEKQLLPFTITQAKDAILQIIEWQFLSRDAGELNVTEDYSWDEDEEPLPAVTDCWAQGLVPKQIIKIKTPEPELTILEVDEDEEAVPAAPDGSLVTDEQLEQDQEAVKDEDTEKSPEETEQQQEPEEPETTDVKPTPAPPVSEKPKTKKRFRPYNGRLKSAGVSNLTETLDHTESRLISEESQSKQSLEEEEEDGVNLLPASCHSILKAQSGRPPGNKDVIYDDHGNVIAVVKFDPAKLPSHFVKTQYTIVDPEVEAAQARLEAMRTGRYIPKSQKQKTTTIDTLGTASGNGPVVSKRGVVSSVRSSFEKAPEKKKQSEVIPLPPPLLETMEVAPGVTVKEGNRIKKGPRMRPKKSDDLILAQLDSLQPVRQHPLTPRFTAADIFENQSPVIRFIQDSAPIPPIPSNRQISA